MNGTPIAINGMSVLAPSGVVNGLASVNVICKPGPMNTPNLAGLAKIAAAIAARALIGPPFGIPGSNGGVPGGGDSDQNQRFSESRCRMDRRKSTRYFTLSWV